MDTLEAVEVWKMKRWRWRQPGVSVYTIVFVVFVFNSVMKPNISTAVAMSLFSNDGAKKIPIIDQWKVSPKDGTLTGIVTGHPIMKDGDEIKTSPLTNPDFAADGEGAVVTTFSGTEYELKTPKNKQKLPLIELVQNTRNIQTTILPSISPMLPVPIKKSRKNTREISWKNEGEPVICDWAIDPSSGRIIGTVTGHPLLPDGDFISASPPIEKYFKEGSIITTETGSRYKLKGSNNNASSFLLRKPHPPALELTQQEIDDLMTKLAETADESHDDDSSGRMLSIVAAAGVAGAVGLNVINNPNTLISTDFENINNAGLYKEKAMMQSNKKKAMALVSPYSRQQENMKSIDGEEESLDKSELKGLQQHEMERKRRLGDEIKVGETIKNSKQEYREQNIRIQNLMQERDRAQLQLELAENIKKKAQHNLAINEKAKIELQRQQKELSQMQRQQRNTLLALNQEKEKLVQKEEIKKVYKEAEEARALGNELEKRLKSEDRSSMLNRIQTGLKGIVAVGFTGTVSLVTSFEIRRRLSKESMSIEKCCEVSRTICSPSDKISNKKQASIPPIRPSPKSSFTTNITDKFKFVNEIDDLLAEVEGVLAEVDGKTIKNKQAEQMTDLPLESSSESISEFLTDGAGLYDGNFTKKGLVECNYFRSQIISSYDNSFQEENIIVPSDSSMEGERDESNSLSGYITLQTQRTKMEKKSVLNAQEEERVNWEDAKQMKIRENSRPERLDSEVERFNKTETTPLKAKTQSRIKTDDEDVVLQAAEATRRQTVEEIRIKPEDEASIQPKGILQIEAKNKETIITANEKEGSPRLTTEEHPQLQFEEYDSMHFDLKVKEESQLEELRRKLLAVRLKEQRQAYESIMKDRMIVEIDCTDKELKVGFEKKRKRIEKQAILQAIEKEHGSMLNRLRMALLKERMKEQTLFFEMELERRKTYIEQRDDLVHREMLELRLKYQKRDSDLQDTMKLNKFENLVEKSREDMLKYRLKSETCKLEVERRNAKREAKAKIGSLVAKKKKSRVKVLQEVKAKKGEQLFIHVENKATEKTKQGAEDNAKKEESMLKLWQEAKAKGEEEWRVETEQETKTKTEEDSLVKIDFKMKEKGLVNVEADARHMDQKGARAKAEQVAKEAKEEVIIGSERDGQAGRRTNQLENAKALKELKIKAEKFLITKEESGGKPEEASAKVEHDTEEKKEETNAAEDGIRKEVEERRTCRTFGVSRIRAMGELNRDTPSDSDTSKIVPDITHLLREEPCAVLGSVLGAKEDIEANLDEKAIMNEEQKAEEGQQEAEVNTKLTVKVKAVGEALIEVDGETWMKTEQVTVGTEESNMQAGQEAKEQVRETVEQEARAIVQKEANITTKDMMKEATIKTDTKLKAGQVREAKAKDESLEVSRVRVEQENAVSVNTEEVAEEAYTNTYVRLKAIQETEVKANEESSISTKEQVKVGSKQNVVSTFEELSKAKDEQGIGVNEGVTRVENKQETKAMSVEGSSIKEDDEDSIGPEEATEVKIAEEIISIGHTRLSELERLEKEFNLIDHVVDDKLDAPFVASSKHQLREPRKVGSKLRGERGSGPMEKIERKIDLIEEQQTEAPVHVKWGCLGQNKVNLLGKDNSGDTEGLEQKIFDDVLSLEETTQVGDGSQVEKIPAPPQHDEIKKVIDTITKSDDLYIPSKKVLANTSLLMKEIAGASLVNYDDKEGVTERDVRIQAGNKFKIPVRVSTPGSIIEFSIEKKLYDFSFGIDAFFDGRHVANIMEMRPFQKKSDSQKVLVPAGSAPCTMQFTFTNTCSTSLEEVRLGYRIRVIPPSAEVVKLGRRRRTKSSLHFLESEISTQNEILKISTLRAVELDRNVTILQNDINAKTAKLESIRVEESRLKKLMSTASGNSLHPNRIDGNKYLNGF